MFGQVIRPVTGALLAAFLLTACGGSEHAPWITEGQRAMYGEEEIQRDADTAEQLRDRLKFSVAER